MSESLYISLFEAAQGATLARLNQEGAQAGAVRVQTGLLDQTTNSWTQYVSRASLRFSVFKRTSQLTSAQVKSFVRKELSAYLIGYEGDNSKGQGSWMYNYFNNELSVPQRNKMQSMVQREVKGGGLAFNHKESTGWFQYSVDKLTTACAKSMYAALVAEGVTSKMVGATYQASHVTLLQLTEEMNTLAKNGASQAERAAMQALLGQAQRSYQAAQDDANSGVEAGKNQMEQDSYFMQQDAMLASTTNASLQQCAGVTISA